MRAIPTTLAVLLVLGTPLVLMGPAYAIADTPVDHSAGHWILEGEVVALREQFPYGSRLVAQPILDFDVHRIIDDGAGAAPDGTIEVPYDEWTPGQDRLREGDVIAIAVARFQNHDPKTGNTTHEGLRLEDVKSGCCWGSRVTWAGLLWLAGPAAVGMAVAAGLGTWRWSPRALAIVFAVVAGLGLGTFIGNLAGPAEAPWEDLEGNPPTWWGWTAWVAGGLGLLAVPLHAYYARRHATGWVSAVAFLSVLPWIGPTRYAIEVFAWAALMALPVTFGLLAWPVPRLRRIGSVLPLLPLLAPLMFIIGGDGEAKVAAVGMFVYGAIPVLLFWGDMRSAWRPVPQEPR